MFRTGMNANLDHIDNNYTTKTMIRAKKSTTKKALVLSVFFVFHLSVFSFAQDSLKSIKISYNIVQACINEQSVYIDYSPFRHHSFGLSVGRIYDNPVFEKLILSPTQNLFPGTVYRGSVYRISYSYIFMKRCSFERYLCAQYVYRDMYYHNKEFRDGGDTHVIYKRNEKATVSGFDVLFGINRYKKLNKNFTFLFNMFTGIGWRERNRTIYTYSVKWYGGGGGPNVNHPPDLGNEKIYQWYLLPVLGIKLGLQYRI
jgi:hypothetical protein